MYDIMIIGQITLDHNIDFDGREEFRTGGAVTFSGYAAAAIGHRVAVVPKGDPQRVDPFATFRDSKVEKVFPVFSPTCTEMENTYFTADRERRLCPGGSAGGTGSHLSPGRSREGGHGRGSHRSLRQAR